MITSRDKKIAGESTLAKTSGITKEQIICISDLISEGPIEGLVEGGSSIYLNDDSFMLATGQGSSIATELNFTTVAGSVSATSDTPQYIDYLDTGVRRIALLLDVWEFSVTKGNYGGEDAGTGNNILLDNLDVTSPTSQMVVASENTAFNYPNATLNYSRDGDLVSLQGYIIEAGDTGEANGYFRFIPDNLSNVALLDIPQNQTLTLNIHYNTVILEWGAVVEKDDPAAKEIRFLTNAPKSGTFKVTVSQLYKTRARQPLDNRNFFELADKYEHSTAQFRTGTLYQPPIEANGIGVNSIQIPNNNFQTLALEFIDANSEDPQGVAAASPFIQGSSSSGFGLSAEQASEADEARLTIKYGSLLNRNRENGNENTARVSYKITLKIIRGLEESEIVLTESRDHYGQTTSPVVFEEVINLEPFKPFTDFAVKFERITRHDGDAIFEDGTTKEHSDIYATSVISGVNAVIKEPLNYPLTSYAHLTFSAKEFPNLPKRTYHVRGLKVKVPDNYTPRELAGSQDPSDLYNGLWTTGQFREERVYTNNPAWVFYDIISNNRYGLGDWISVDDVDKYALYRIAKYCDELVPDGKGGLEPRFTANIYLTKAADAYKVLKDFATIFIGIMYWTEGELKAVADMRSDPIYNFSKSNVIKGEFSYESTGSKTRANQVIVTWNDPELNYAQRNIIVEDKENIVKTGKLISEQAVAFGCTSEGQAIRYGRWKLWTSINQTEIVSFKTSLDSAFLMPGDIINVQDSGEYNVRFSGRVSSSAQPTTTSMTIDSPVYLQEGNQYELNIILEDLSSPNEGEQADRPVKVEKVSITNPTGSNVSALTFDALSSAPKAGAIWTIVEKTVEGTALSSSKEYRILAITEDSKSQFSITAVEYYSTKFDDITKEFSLVTPDTVYPKIPFSAEPPKVKNLYIHMDADYNKGGNEFILMWDLPEQDNISNEVAEILVYHTISGYESPLRFSSSITKYVFEGVSDGSYSVGVSTVGPTGNKSGSVFTKFTVEDKFALNVPRGAGGLPIGGSAGTTIELANNILGFAYASPSLATIANPVNVYRGEIASLDISSLASGTYSIVFDRSEQSLIPCTYIKDTALNVNYWKNNLNNNDFISATGSVSVQKTRVTGVSTVFTSEFSVGSLIKMGSVVAKIVYIESDTELLIDRTFNSTIVDSSISKLSFEPDYIEDSIVAELYVSTEDTFKAYTSVDKSLNAVSVSIESSIAGFTFKNGSGDEKTLSAVVYDGDNLVTSGVTYHWKRDGITIKLDTDNRVDMSNGTINAVGSSFSSIIVGHEDIDDGSSNLITCEATVV